MSASSEFITSDIILATFLKCRNVPFIKIVALDTYHSQFVFAPVSDELLREWLHTVPQVDVRAAVANYRHLIRDARTLQQEGQEVQK